jgi:DegV family protein with EDD domain
VTDSNCDLPPKLVADCGITVVPMYVNVGTKSYLDGIEMSRQTFYEGLSGFPAYPTTSVPSPGQFYEAYEQLVSEGASEILSIHVSTTLSAVANSARLAAEEIDSVAVTILDSGNLTLGTGFLVLTACRAASAGHTMDEIVALLEDQRARTHSFAALDTLEFLRRSGRLSRLQSGLGSLLQIKPVIKVHDGEIDLERVRTRKRAVERLRELVTELGPLEELAVVHTHAFERAESLQRRSAFLFPAGKVPLTAEVTPVIGAHVGPGAVGFVAIQAR